MRNQKPDFTDVLFTVQLGNQKKDLKTILVKSALLFANYVSVCETTVLKNCFSNPFSNFQKKMKERESKNSKLSQC